MSRPSRQPVVRPVLSRLGHRIAMLTALALLALVPERARAAGCSFDWFSSQGTYSVSVPSTIVNDPDIPLNSVLYTSMPTPINHPVSFSCNGNGNGWGLVNNAGSTPAAGVNLFPIGTSGVSYRVLQNSEYIYPYPYLDLGNKGWYEADTVTIELVKTGPITDGSSIQGSLANFKAGTDNNYIINAVINLANRLTFTTPACQITTPNINVRLPMATSQSFSGVDSVAGTTPFQIRLTCSSGATLLVTLDTAAPVNGKPGVIAPSSGGASGIGVQLLDSSGVTPVVFGTPKVIGATPDGALSVAYFARYYQTASTVGAGPVNATATFTLSYQ